jgi:hypothetical protein
MYQNITDDESGNTLAHIIVDQRDADELYKLIKKNYISNTVINKEKKTVRALAFDKFRVFTLNTTTIDLHKEESAASRCCNYMLDKYFAGDNFDKKENCCSKHIVTKKYIDYTPNKFCKSQINLPEEPQDDRCCGWLLTYFKEKVD